MTRNQHIEIGLTDYLNRIEKKIDDNHCETKSIFNQLKTEIDSRVKKEDFTEHKNNHWKIAGLSISGSGLIASLIGIFHK